MMLSNTKGIPILSFFTGGGLLDIGFMQAGFEVVWTNEIDPFFARLYAAGMTSLKNSRGIAGCFTITNIGSINELRQETIMAEAFPRGKPDVFGIIGGPPCQDFSTNGNLNGFKGDRGSLTDAFLYKILELQPAFFVMENVAGLLRVKKHAKHFLELLRVMQEDYQIEYTVLNSLDFGVPQFRERVFVIGINRAKFGLGSSAVILEGLQFSFPVNQRYYNAFNKYAWPGVAPFGEEPAAPDGIPLELCIESCLVPAGEEELTPNASEYFKLQGGKKVLENVKEGETNRRSFKRLHRFRFSPTACYGNNEVHLHPYQHRRLSVREVLRIQGVCDKYVLPPGASMTKKFKMIANGVPVPLAAAVARQLSTYLNQLLVKETVSNGSLIEEEA